MRRKTKPAISGAEPAEPLAVEELKAEGPGPFHLPACGGDISIYNDGEVAIVTFRTMRRQRVGVPIPSFALRNLGLALIAAAGTKKSNLA